MSSYPLQRLDNLSKDIETIDGTLQDLIANANVQVNIESVTIAPSSNVLTLEGNVANIEDDISQLQTNLVSTTQTLESNIQMLENDVSNLESNVNILIDANISAIQGNIQILESDVSNIQSNIDVIESNIDTLEANVDFLYQNREYIDGNLTVASITSNSLTVTDPIGIRNDVLTGLTVSGDTFIKAGILYGDGRGLTGLSGGDCTDLESRLRAYATSPYRLYVSTTGSDGNSGRSPDQALRTIRKAADMAQTGYTIFVESGTYDEVNPITLRSRVAVIGDSLRTTLITARNPQLDLFHTNNAGYFSQLRFIDLRSPGFGVAYPCSLADVQEKDGTIMSKDESTEDTKNRVPIIYSPKNYYSAPLPPTTTVPQTRLDARLSADATTITAIENAVVFDIDGENAFSVFAPLDWIQIGSEPQQIININSQRSMTLVKQFRESSVEDATLSYGTSSWTNVPDANVFIYDYTIPGTGSDASRTFRVTGTDQDAAHPVYNMLDGASTTRWQSSTSHRDFNNTIDATGVSIELELPIPQRYVGYRILDTNLKKWNLYARETPSAPWDTISSVEELPKTDPVEIDRVVSGLLNGFADYITNPNSASWPAHDGNFLTAAALLLANRPFIAAETMAWLQPQAIYTIMSPTQRDKCRRDVGLMLDAVVHDLTFGGYEKTLEYASYYFDGSGVSVLPQDQRTPTANSIRYVGALAVKAATKLEVRNPGQTSFRQQFEGISLPAVPENPPVRRTTATKHYSYYKIECLQNTTNTTFTIGRLQFFTMDVPICLADAPLRTGTRVSGFEILDPGSGYTSAPGVTITDPSGNNTENAVAQTTISGGQVTSITLVPETTDKVQSVTLTDPGAGYTTAPTVAFETSGGQETQQAVAYTILNKDGTVRDIRLIWKGDGYTQTPQVSLIGQSTSFATATASRLGRLQGGANYSGDPVVEIGTFQAVGGRRATAIAIMDDDFAELTVPEYRVPSDPVANPPGSELNIDAEGRLQTVLIEHRGNGYQNDDVAFENKPFITIPPPESIKPVIVASCYVQNCSNISGPWDQTGQKVSARHPLPFNVLDIYDDGIDNPNRKIIDPNGSGGGIRCDGAVLADYSPLRSVVVDAYTQVNQGGIGALFLNKAYAQLVSFFGTYCNTHVETTTGSFCNLSNSVTDFGAKGVVARGKSRTYYLKAKAIPPNSADFLSEAYGFVDGLGYRSSVISLTLEKGAGYDPNSSPPTVTISDPEGYPTSGTQQAVASIEVASDSTPPGQLENLVLETVNGVRGGRGFKTAPVVTFDEPPSYPPTGDSETKILGTATATLSGVRTVRVQISDKSQRPGNTKPDVLSLARIHGKMYNVQGSGEAVDENGDPIPDTYDMTFSSVAGDGGGPSYVDLEHEIEFYLGSYATSGGHVFEYCGGAGAENGRRQVTYNSLPEFGGVNDSNYQIVTQGEGRVFHTSTDSVGNFTVGKYFSVNQSTGKVQLDTTSFDLTGIESIQFKRNGTLVGVPLREVSDNPALLSSTGAADSSTVPTQTAVQAYVQPRAVPGGGNPGEVLRRLSNEDGGGFAWRAIDLRTAGVVQVGLRADVITGLIAENDAKVYGNVTCDTIIANDGVQFTLPQQAPTTQGRRQCTISLPNDTTLEFTVRGDDGTERTATLTLS